VFIPYNQGNTYLSRLKVDFCTRSPNGYLL
jgi:hypothetical protein